MARRKLDPGEVTEVIAPVTDGEPDDLDPIEDRDDLDGLVEPNAVAEAPDRAAATSGRDGSDDDAAASPPAHPSRAARIGAWFRPRLPRQLASIAAGLLLYASFPPVNWWWAAFIAFGVLAVVLTREATSIRGGFGYGYLSGLAFNLPLLPWVGIFVGPGPWLVLAALCALFPALFGLLAVLVRRVPGWPIWFALVWVLTEWLKSVIPFGGFPWGVVGFGQTTGPLLALAQLGGIPLVSAAVVLVGAAGAALLLEVIAWWRRDRSTAGTDLPPAVLVPGVCIAAVLLTVALVYPQIRQSGAGAGDDPAVTVAVVQGNVPRMGLDFNAQRRAVLDNHVAETLRLAEDVRTGRAAQPQFVLWPENSADIDPLANADAREQISTAARAIGAPILVGGVVAGPNWTPEVPASRNTVIVWDPVRGPGVRHDKRIVQPFGEYLPLRGVLRYLSSYADRAGYFEPGDGDGVLDAAGVPIGVATCWEVIFDRAPRQSVLEGAQVLAVPTNNATFDVTMSEQQLAIARARAVEHDRYVVVAGTTGISAIIAPDGRELARTEFFEPDHLVGQVRLKTVLTPATQWGPITQFILVAAGFAVVLAAAGAAIRQNGMFMRPTRRRRQSPRTDSAGPTTDSDAPRADPSTTTEESHDQ